MYTKHMFWIKYTFVYNVFNRRFKLTVWIHNEINNKKKLQQLAIRHTHMTIYNNLKYSTYVYI